MMLVIRTQYEENYGAHDWDGTGECPQYWKMKGGSEYKILDVPLNIDYTSLVNFALTGIAENNDYCRNSMIDWSIEDDNYLSWYEKSQLEYDGEVLYKEPSMMYNDVMDKQKELVS
jgi:hypothetical protein